MKKTLLFIAAALISSLAMFAQETSGICGDHATWTYDSVTTTLSISGKGVMENYQWNAQLSRYNLPWHPFVNSITTVTISEGITSVGWRSFNGCTALTSVSMPEGIVSIGDGAFSECSALATVTIPSSVKSIGSGAFYGCSALTALTIPEGVTSISSSAFYGCSSLASVNIPAGLKSISYGMFKFCKKLASIDIPESVTTIGNDAFNGCTSLTSVSMPEGIISVGNETFKECTAITHIETPAQFFRKFPETLALVSIKFNKGSIKSEVFTALKGMNASIKNVDLAAASNTSIPEKAFSGCDKLETIMFPADVTKIGVSAFENCSSLNQLVIPSKVTEICDKAFALCSNIKSMQVDAAIPPVIYEATFQGVSRNIRFSVPEGSEDAYRNHEFWKEFTPELVAVDKVEDNAAQVFTTNGELIISTEDTADYTVYNANGQILRHGTTSGSVIINDLPRGIYLVSINDTTHKVAL